MYLHMLNEIYMCRSSAIDQMGNIYYGWFKKCFSLLSHSNNAEKCFHTVKLMCKNIYIYILLK